MKINKNRKLEMDGNNFRPWPLTYTLSTKADPYQGSNQS